MQLVALWRFACLGPSRVNVALQGTKRKQPLTRADLIRILMNKELEEHRNLTREQARAVVSEIFVAIKEALRDGETLTCRLGPLAFRSKAGSPYAGGF